MQEEQEPNEAPLSRYSQQNRPDHWISHLPSFFHESMAKSRLGIGLHSSWAVSLLQCQRYWAGEHAKCPDDCYAVRPRCASTARAGIQLLI